MPDASQKTEFQNQARMLANRVKKRFRHLRKRFARQRIEVFRLYDWDIPEIRAVVDPPSFSTSRVRSQSFDIVRDHARLLGRVVTLMRSGGLIFFSTNHQQSVPAMTELAVKKIEEITDRTLPEDYRTTRRVIHRCWRIEV